jgi:calcium-dependent protein kinase
VKTIPKILLEDSGLWQEIEMMRKVDHPHITRLYCTFEDLSNIYMFAEYCSGGELFEKLVKHGKFPEDHCKRIMRQMVSAVCYLHGQNICHRDLKPENFLLARPVQDVGEAHVKLIDFGTARTFGPGTKPMTTKICSLHYVAPEILSRKEVNYNEKCDVWSLGVLLYLVLSGMTPFYGDTEMQILKMVKKARYTFDPPDIWDEISESAKELIRKCMQINADNRLEVQEIAEHEWLVSGPTSCSNISSQQLIDNMRAFKAQTRMKKVALQVIAQYLADDRISELRTAFLELDTQNKGSLTFGQVEQAVKKAGVVMDSDTELRELLSAMSSGSKVLTEETKEETPVNYTQFLAATIDREQYLSDEVLREAFHAFDVNGIGEFGKEEMLLVFSGNLNNTMDVTALCDNVDCIIDEVAPDGATMLNYEAFVHLMKAEPPIGSRGSVLQPVMA